MALSRVRSLSGLHLLGWNDLALRVHPEVLKKDVELRAASRALSDVCGRAEFRKPGSGTLNSMLQRAEKLKAKLAEKSEGVVA